MITNQVNAEELPSLFALVEGRYLTALVAHAMHQHYELGHRTTSYTDAALLQFARERGWFFAGPSKDAT